MICPEGLRVAQAYLQNKSDVHATAHFLELPVSEVERYLNTGEVKRYLDRLYMEGGFRNRELMGSLVDEIIKQKIEEMQETGLGSGKDIMEILQIAHNMKMKELEMEIKLRASNTPTIQVNQQNNISGGDKYNELLERIMGGVVEST